MILPFKVADKILCPGGGGGHSLCREAPPERGAFVRLQVYERVEISLVEVYEREGKSVIWVCKKDQKGPTEAFYGFERDEKTSWICNISKTGVHLHQFEGMRCSRLALKLIIFSSIVMT